MLKWRVWNKKIIFSLIVIFILSISAGIFFKVFLTQPDNTPPIEIEDTIVGIIDKVGLYQKNGRIEEYGLDVYQEPAGPISIGSTEFHINEQDALFIWYPRNLYLTSPSLLFLSGQHIKNVNFKIGIIIDGKCYSFSNNVSTSLPPNIPEDIKSFLTNPTYHNNLIFIDKKNQPSWIGELPFKEISNVFPKIDAIFIVINNAKSQNLILKEFTLKKFSVSETREAQLKSLKQKIKHLLTRSFKKSVKSFIKKIKKELKSFLNSFQTKSITLIGTVKGAFIPVGGEVLLRTEDNKTFKTFISLDGHFSFEDLPAKSVVSISYKYNEQEYYTQLGRWFELSNTHNDLVIDLTPSYVNTTGKKRDATTFKLVGRTQESPQDNIYEPHTRLEWAGINIIQCYDSKPFTNNLGYLDRDRFAKNPKKCYRIIHFGGSSAVGLQVNPSEKYNTLLEQDLAVRLGRCVEVISLGRDNGDIGTQFKRLKFFVEHYKPDLVLIENLSALMMQIQPNLLERLHGFDFHKNIFPHFSYDSTGQLQFVDLSPEHPLYMHEKNSEELTPGVPLTSSLSVPFNHMHPYAKEAWTYLRDIFNLYQKLFPNQKFALHSSIDQAQCRQPCKVSYTKENIPFGAEIFVQNFQEFCDKEHITCFHPQLRPELNQLNTLIPFPYDGHFSERGHQWLAKELANSLEAFIKSEKL